MIPFLPGKNWRNDPPLLPMNPPPPLPNQTDATKVKVNQGQQLYAGANPLLQNNPDINGIINLDTNHASDDPSKALLDIVAQKAGCTVDELKTKDFEIQKGFRPEKNSNEPIPIFAHSNPPGPDCYYLVRHWRVTVKDAQGQDLEMHFTKKIYTSVQVPANLDATEHKQQQYIAALAARTYANIEESRMIFGATGKENDLYKSVGTQMAKIAHDRFVTMEMFNNAKNVTVNPSKKNKISDTTVDHIQLRFRVTKADPKKGDRKLEQFHTIPLKAATALELKEKIYRFQGENTSSAHARTVATSLNREEALNLIKNEDMSPTEAYAEVGLTLSEARGAIVSEINGKNAAFYNDLAYFNDRKSLSSLMTNHTKDNYQLSQDILNKITSEKSILERLNLKKPVPQDLAALIKLNTLLEGNPTASIQKDASRLLEAATNVYNKMNASNEMLSKLEKELDATGAPVDPKSKLERDDILKTMNNLIQKWASSLPNEPIANKGAAVDTDILDNIDEDDGVTQSSRGTGTSHKVVDDKSITEEDEISSKESGEGAYEKI